MHCFLLLILICIAKQAVKEEEEQGNPWFCEANDYIRCESCISSLVKNKMACLAGERRWYFNNLRCKCEHFIWAPSAGCNTGDGVENNPNNFRTEKECKLACREA